MKQNAGSDGSGIFFWHGCNSVAPTDNGSRIAKPEFLVSPMFLVSLKPLPLHQFHRLFAGMQQVHAVGKVAEVNSLFGGWQGGAYSNHPFSQDPNHQTSLFLQPLLATNCP